MLRVCICVNCSAVKMGGKLPCKFLPPCQGCSTPGSAGQGSGPGEGHPALPGLGAAQGTAAQQSQGFHCDLAL